MSEFLWESRRAWGLRRSGRGGGVYRGGKRQGCVTWNNCGRKRQSRLSKRFRRIECNCVNRLRGWIRSARGYIWHPKDFAGINNIACPAIDKLHRIRVGVIAGGNGKQGIARFDNIGFHPTWRTLRADRWRAGWHKRNE